MNWIELTSFASLLFLFLLSFLMCRKLGVQFSKVTVSLPVIITITILNTFLFRFIERKFDDHSQLETNKKINQKPLPVQNKGEDYLPNENQEVEEVCCGGLPEEERQAFKQRLESAWTAGSDSDPEFVQLLPAHDASIEAETTFKQSAGPFVADDGSEIDWDQARLQMLLGAEASGGEISKAMVAEMMLEADSFMKTMTEADAEAIEKRTQEIWDRMSLRLPEQMLEGTNAVIWRKTFELQAAVERSIMVFDDSADLHDMDNQFNEHLEFSSPE